MSSWLKLALVALVAFVLGFAAARRFPTVDPTPAEDFAWERTGDTVRLTAKTPGESYLIVQGGAGDADPFSPGASPSWSVETAESINVKSPMAILRLMPGKCSHNDCPPPPAPPSRGQSRFVLLKIKRGYESSLPDLPTGR